jgi:hypothetical protein
LKLIYRIQQFFRALNVSTSKIDFQGLDSILSSDQIELFQQMHPFDQEHCYRVYERLIRDGNDHPDLLVAALLHDVGKSKVRIWIWERVIIVIGNPFIKSFWVRFNKNHKCSWFSKLFMVSEFHPDWGAEKAEEAGASPLVVDLIRRHQNQIPVSTVCIEDKLLNILQFADRIN